MVESVLEDHEDILQSCVVGVVDGDDQVLKAFFMVEWETLDTGDTAELEAELRALCEGKLPAHARPRFYVFRDALPLTAAGKVDYRKLEYEIS